MQLSEIYPLARIGANGDLLFPHRGDPPKTINGYLVDKGDRYIFHPVLEVCKHRTSCWHKVCGGMVQCYNCNKFLGEVKLTDCLNCHDHD